MTGSTLYRRLPDGSWAAEREDLGQRPAEPAAAPMAAAAGAPAAAAPVGRGPTAAPTVVRPGRRRSPAGRALRVLRWAIVGYVAWLAFLGVYAAVSLQQIPALPPQQIPDTPGQVWLLVGSDSRDSLTARQRRELRTGGEEGQRTDTIMLLHTPTGSITPRLVSVPRDSWVTIPAHTATDGSEVGPRSNKINAAYQFGGPQLLTQTIEYNTGLHVDHYMEVGMTGIVELTDAVGGVEVCFEEAIVDEYSGLDVEAGCQVLDGRDALAWVRMRYADPTGDLGRMQRQQEWVRLTVDEVLSWQTLVNPFRQWGIVTAATDAVAVDEDSGVLSVGRLGLGMARVASGSAEIATVPTLDDDHWENGQWVLKWDPAEAGELFAAMGGSTPQAQVDTP
jgi:LCP family protein required for cell wall assembly